MGCHLSKFRRVARFLLLTQTQGCDSGWGMLGGSRLCQAWGSNRIPPQHQKIVPPGRYFVPNAKATAFIHADILFREHNAFQHQRRDLAPARPRCAVPGSFAQHSRGLENMLLGGLATRSRGRSLFSKGFARATSFATLVAVIDLPHPTRTAFPVGCAENADLDISF